MIAALAELLETAQPVMISGFVVFLRVGAVMALLPGFGEQSVPARIRLVLALAFTVIVAPVVVPGIDAPLDEMPRARVFLTEIIAGLSLGLLLRLLVMILQIAGTVAAQSTSLSQIFGGAGVDPQPAMGHVMVTAGLALAMMMGFHVHAAEAMILTYEIMPPGQLPDPSVLADWGVGRIAWGFGLAVTLAMPFVIASLIYNLALGVINRAMPQLMVAMVGAPAITAGGLILLFLALPMILGVWGEALEQSLSNPFGAIR